MPPLEKNELQALALFASGRSGDEIARALGLSVSMVNHCLRNAARKLGARNRVHAIAIAVSTGLVDPTPVRE